MKASLNRLLEDVRACQLCVPQLVDGVRPVLQAHARSRILIAGQAPGRRVHLSGVPFRDPSGDRLREWMSVEEEEFYDARQVAILPMGFCFPGSGKSGDLPPRSECAEAWRAPLLERMSELHLTLVIGQYAQEWHLSKKAPLTETVRGWRDLGSELIPLPHPSPRNNIWLRRNPWFAAEVLPELKRRVQTALAGGRKEL